MEIEALTEKKKEFPSPPLGERGRGEGAASPPAVPLTLYPSPPVGERESQIVRIARSWIGTPYVHQASLKGVGCDCLGLLRGIWRELRGEEPEEIPPYSLDWAEATGAETLYMALARHCREVALPPFTGGVPPQAGRGAELDPLQPGNIALFRMLPRGPAKHCGIVGERIESPRPHACGGEGQGVRGIRRAGIGHQESLGLTHRLTDTRCSVPDVRNPLTLNPSPPKGGEGNSMLTLIHARQNKRVSEEPFSAFWRGKLAYAFRV